MKRRFLLACGLTVCLAAGVAMAGEKPAVAPSTADIKAKEAAALDQKVSRLIRQLDDINWEKREAATEELEKIGKPALPKLKEALRNSTTNAELQSRLEKIINTIEPPQTPAKPQGANRMGGMRNFQQFMVGGRVVIPQEPVQVPTRESLDLLAGFGAKLEVIADGLRVIDLRDDSMADKLGLQRGDFINKANGKTLATVDDAKKSLAEVTIAMPLDLEIQREGKIVVLSNKAAGAP